MSSGLEVLSNQTDLLFSYAAHILGMVKSGREKAKRKKKGWKEKTYDEKAGKTELVSNRHAKFSQNCGYQQ